MPTALIQMDPFIVCAPLDTMEMEQYVLQVEIIYYHYDW